MHHAIASQTVLTRLQRSLAFVTALLLFTVGLSPSAPDPPTPGWGPEHDGLSCRVIAKADYAIGQGIDVRLEIRNTSKHTRYLFYRFDKDSRPLRVVVTNPDGKKLWEQDGDDTPPRHRMWHPIKAGETWDLPLLDLSAHFVYDTVTHWQGAFHQPGNYQLKLSYHPPKLRASMITGTISDGDEQRSNREDTPAEILNAAWHGTLTAPPVTFRVVPVDDLAVHEWGVFTVYNDLRFANADRKAEWSSLPEEFYRQFPKTRLQWVPSAWDKPIIYFHTARPNLRFRTSVNFGEGAPVVWWPAVAKPLDETPGRRPEVSKVKLFHELEWHGWLGEKLPANEFRRGREAFAAELFALPEKLWLQQARNVPEASTITVHGTALSGGAPWVATRPESEKFLYYDGLVPAPDYLRCTRSDADSVTVSNTAKFDIGPLLVADQRGASPGGSILGKLAAGSTVQIRFASGLSADTLAKRLDSELQAAGLLESEAGSILTIWRRGLFERPGVTACYLLPRSEYERMLPISIKPKPASLVRVGIVRQPNFEAEPVLAERANTLIEQLNSDDPKTRLQATRSLIAFGPVAIRLLKATLEKKPDPETARGCRLILNQLDASDYLPQQR